MRVDSGQVVAFPTLLTLWGLRGDGHFSSFATIEGGTTNMNSLKTNWMNKAAIVMMIAGTATTTMGADDASALERLEAARIAFENARAELQAAQAEVALITGKEVEVDTTTASASRDVQPDTEPETPADPTSWKDGWDFSANVGISGSTGNTESVSGRAALSGERDTSKYETSLAMAYTYASADGNKSTSRGEIALRNDWLTDSKWRYFAQGKYEYDEFQQWDHRLSGAVGIGYEFVKDDKHELIGRAGLGGSYEMGGTADEKFIPEGLLGLDWKYIISENSTLKASTTYYPSFDDFGEFRWVSGAGLEVVMDKESGMTLNTGFEHRHDSDPGSGFKNNDLDYYMGLGWKF